MHRSERAVATTAVLPLQDRSGDPEQEFFAERMTDALIADLTHVGALRGSTDGGRVRPALAVFLRGAAA